MPPMASEREREKISILRVQGLLNMFFEKLYIIILYTYFPLKDNILSGFEVRVNVDKVFKHGVSKELLN